MYEIGSKYNLITKYNIKYDRRAMLDYACAIRIQQLLLYPNITEEQKANRIHKVITKVNDRLKQIGEALDLPITLTTYVARHSQATVMKKAGVSTAVIREIMGHSSERVTQIYLMGHSSERVTQIYLDSFDNEQIDKAMKSLF